MIIGAGAVGLLCAVAARLEGCTRVAIADIVGARVDFAIEHKFADAGFVVPAKSTSNAQDQMQMAKQMALSIGEVKHRDGSLVGPSDYTFECTGVESCVQASIFVCIFLESGFLHADVADTKKATKAGGKTILVGMGTPHHLLPISEASAREVDIVPVWRYANCYPRAIEIMLKSMEDGAVPNIRQMLTHRFYGLESVPAALECACKSLDDSGNMVIKVVVNLSDVKEGELA
jgi:L-iditol 2-dehydrogenase